MSASPRAAAPRVRSGDAAGRPTGSARRDGDTGRDRAAQPDRTERRPSRARSASARAAGPDHTSPWVLDTRTMGRRPGTLKRVRLTAFADAPIGSESVSVPAGAPVVLELRLEPVAEGVLVSGTATADTVAECSRCLTEVRRPVEVDLRELYAYPDSATAATTDDDEVPRLVDDLIDLFPLVRDEIVLVLPLAPLCRADCPGLCPDCGERFDDLEPGHRHEILDPRWAALRGRFESGEE